MLNLRHILKFALKSQDTMFSTPRCLVNVIGIGFCVTFGFAASTLAQAPPVDHASSHYTVDRIPSSIPAWRAGQTVGFKSQGEIGFAQTGQFEEPSVYASGQAIVRPIPLGYGLEPYFSGDDRNTGTQLPSPKLRRPGFDGWNPNAGRDEYVYDGSDRAQKVQVDFDFNVTGLQTEDTVGHFDTLDGRRIVTPSNRVAIYAPRFGAVRRVDGVFKANINLPVGAFEERTPIAQAKRADDPTTTKQHLALKRYAVTKRASAFLDQTRGVTSDNVTRLFGARNSLASYEDLSLIRYGKMSSGETARLRLGLQSASVWQDDLELQVSVNKSQPIIVRDIKQTQELLSIKSDDGTAILRVTKIASKIAARAGEFVDFTIRYDNLSDKKIGNVTLIDNLTRRLEYVPGSAESTLKADFINERNDADSLMLRWEIIDPVEPHSGGVIRFKCRVR